MYKTDFWFQSLKFLKGILHHFKVSWKTCWINLILIIYLIPFRKYDVIPADAKIAFFPDAISKMFFPLVGEFESSKKLQTKAP